jgi:DNA polymerase-3 subunit epsilon
MLHTLLTLSRPLIVFDFETTSLGQDARIVEIGFKRFTADGVDKSWRGYVNPGIPIPPEAITTHGITNEMVKDAPVWDKAFAENLAKGFSNCDLCGKNVWYDIRVMMAECTRVGVYWSPKGARILDADRLEALAEPRDLSSLYKRRTGKEPHDAHTAMADVEMTIEVIEAQLRTFSTLPRDLDALHALQWPNRIDSEGKFKFSKAGVPYITFGAHREKPLDKVPASYWKWILGADFSAEVKAIAAEAIKGAYPRANNAGDNSQSVPSSVNES